MVCRKPSNKGKQRWEGIPEHPPLSTAKVRMNTLFCTNGKNPNTMSKRPVTNPYCQPSKSSDLLAERATFLHKIRSFFRDKGFLEVETPTLIPCADPSPHLDSFRTHYRTFSPSSETTGSGYPLFLRTSPEFAMKQLVSAGYENIFQICKFFRNGEISSQHNPEFTGLEWYASHCDYETLMDLTEEMCMSLWEQPTLTYQGHTVDLSQPWERLTVWQSIQRYADVQIPSNPQRSDLAQVCQALGLSVQEDDAWDDLFFKIFLTYVEPHLGMERPTFLMDYPIQLAALSRPKPNMPYIAERVELYIAGVELANGYSELIDPVEQKRRWLEEAEYRKNRGETNEFPLDAGLMTALESGMPECTGIAIGLDRLLMLQRNAASIQDVLPFPLKAIDPNQ